MTRPLVVAITGASGAPFAVRLLRVLARDRYPVHLTISPSGAAVVQQELGITLDLGRSPVRELLSAPMPWHRGDSGDGLAESELVESELVDGAASILYHHYQDYGAPIASGSHLTAGMIVCPCSGSTLSAIAHAGGANLIQRAAEVHLKERRPLVLVPRETPLSLPQIENMQRVVAAGGIMLPAMPGWYHGVAGVDDLVNFVVGRILDQFELGDGLMRRWGETL